MLLLPGWQVRYVEAMGSGSKLADAMELSALGSVIGLSGRQEEGACLVASGKANLGHSEAAAGVMSLIRAALVLHHGAVPPALHLKTLTDLVPVQRMGLEVPTSHTPLLSEADRREGRLAVVGVSALGIGGTSSHVVLEAAPPMVEQMMLDDDEVSQ